MQVDQVVLKLLRSKLGNFFFNGAILRISKEMRIDKQSRIAIIHNQNQNLVALFKQTINKENKIEEFNFFPIKTKLLPFKDNLFDLILCEHVINNLNEKDLEFLLTEIYRIMKPSGVALLWDFNWPKRKVSFLRRYPFKQKINYRDHVNDIFKVTKKKNISFFTEVHIRPFLFPLIKRYTVLIGKPPEKE